MKDSADSFDTRGTLTAGDREYQIYRLARVAEELPESRTLPFTLRVLLENLLRHEDGQTVTKEDIVALANWQPQAKPDHEIAFTPARVLLQDFTGVPAVVDLAAMRDAMARMGGDASKINPLQPVELVIDHSVQVDRFASPTAMRENSEIEYERNRERYAFLRWGKEAFRNLAVVPPETGIVHQVNLEYLARVVFGAEDDARPALAYPDTLVGTDSHTTMINGIGVLGWGVGGIEAEAAMLGQPLSMLIPQVVGMRLVGTLPDGATATDLVLSVTEVLRNKGVVGRFVEFFGSGLTSLPLADRATIANMAPEYGATCGFFPVDGETLRYLRFSGRSEARAALVEEYCKAQLLWYSPDDPEPRYTETLELDLASIRPSVAGPKRPQDRIDLAAAKTAFASVLPSLRPPGSAADGNKATVELAGQDHELRDGAVVIAAITSCTNTSNPSVMVGAGLLARNAVRRGLTTPPWVKTSLAPGSKVVTQYLDQAGLTTDLEKLGFHTVGYGCTTCIGNSGPLPEAVEKALAETPMVVASVLSGNRNFEGRIHAAVRANYLMSPPLVVAYALAGRMDVDLETEPLGVDGDDKPVYLREIWPSPQEVAETCERSLTQSMYAATYETVFVGDDRWRALPVPAGETFAWGGDSTYIRHPPFFEAMPAVPPPLTNLAGARALALLGDSVTTDHISPAGAIQASGPAGAYLQEHGVAPADFNSYGSRRGNHEVMMRGTFANIRLRNQLAPGTEGGVTRHQPSGEQMTIFAAAERYRAEAVPLVVIAGREYGTGSSRDWAAKGPALLGVRAAIAMSYERIHRSNLVGMGIAPLEFLPGEGAEALGLTGAETYDISGFERALTSDDRQVEVRAVAADGAAKTFRARLRIDTPREADYYRHGGILRYVLRNLL